MDTRMMAEKIIASRRGLAPSGGYIMPRDQAAEGGCGVIGMAANVQIAASHMLESLSQMRNRGNGKGGGIAAVGLVPEEFGVSAEVMTNDYLLAVAYLDDSVREALEQEYVYRVFDVDHVYQQPHVVDFRQIDELDVKPPEVVLYFVRPKEERLAAFMNENGMQDWPRRKVEDELVYQNTYKLNMAYYQSTGEKQAFVLSHGKNLLVLKMVGYGDDVIRYYQLEEMHAHVWIGHHRYPTKGRVWHPGGAHPFIGLNEALVHNGDFANHASISEYLAQRNIYPLFLTDTEVAVQVFDLLHRTYEYPLEYVIEAMAPTTERDFTQLPDDKRQVYAMLQQSHMHCSPDGPWFFLIAQSDTEAEGGPKYSLTGITDTSMLRPQVFAWQERHMADGEKVAIGLAASEKQGIDAALLSLSEQDARFWRRADRYWNARGGSHTDGGAFVFGVQTDGKGKAAITCEDKFGRPVPVPTSTEAYMKNGKNGTPSGLDIPPYDVDEQFGWYKQQILEWDYDQLQSYLLGVAQMARQRGDWHFAINLLTLILDRRYDTGNLRRSSVLSLIDQAFGGLLQAIKADSGEEFVYIAGEGKPPRPLNDQQTVILDARGYTPQDETSVAREIQRLYANGFKKMIVVHSKGHRFIGNGLGANVTDLRIDVYGSPGDYLGSGLDGVEVHVHNNGQDQLAQIMKSGKLVIHGDVGQTFMYAAKGGQVYVLGNAAGRPLINAVGKPRVVINGTCLDYLAESFMAGDPLHGGGFVVLNGMTFDEDNQIVELDTPYPGGNLFSLASGGAIYIRDPQKLVGNEQLNGGEFAELSDEDWALIKPYLEENERLFDIPLSRLLTVDGGIRQPAEVYRKIQPYAVRALQAEEAWVTKGNKH